MIKPTIVFALLAVALLSGCGNSELESAVYRIHKGAVYCPLCSDDRESIFERFRKSNAGCINKCVKNAGAYEGVIYDAMCANCKKLADAIPDLTAYPISKVKSEKTSFDDVWKVTVFCKCPAHGDVIAMCYEYAFKNQELNKVKQTYP